RTPKPTKAMSRHRDVDAVAMYALAPFVGRARASAMRGNHTTRFFGCLFCRLARSSSWYRNLADVLRHFVALLNRRPLRNRRVPARHVGILLEIDGLPLVARDPGPDGDVGDGITVGDEFASREPAVEHAIEAPRFLEKTLFGIRRLALVVLHEMVDLPE